ncbi:MAG TPA: FHA domain-containing protein [Hyphomicrobiales bacterium]|nr:FHA domain-containing protein [Hyphomicrobiales bacterium]
MRFPIPFTVLRRALFLTIAACLGAITMQAGAQAQRSTDGFRLIPSQPPARVSNLPSHLITCEGSGAGSQPRLRCTLRLEKDKDTVPEGATVASEDGNVLWRTQFTASSLRDDQTAFLFLISSSNVSREGFRSVSDLRTMVRSLGEQQVAAIYSFADTSTLLTPFTKSKGDLERGASSVRPQTAAPDPYRAANEAIEILRQRSEPQRILVIQADGRTPDPSLAAAQTVADTARRAGVRIFFLGYQGTGDPQAGLNRLAEFANGKAFSVEGSGRTAFDRLIRAFGEYFAYGGTIEAEAPDRRLPSRVRIAVQFSRDRRSEIVTTVAQGDAGAEPMAIPGDEGRGLSEIPGVIRSALEGDTRSVIILSAAGLALIALAVLALSVVRSRPQRAAQALSPNPVPINPAPWASAESAGVRQAAHEKEIIPTVVAEPVEAEQKGRAIAFFELHSPVHERFPITRRHIRVGRLGEKDGVIVNDIVLTPQNVSKEHAEIIMNPSGHFEIVNRTWDRPQEDGGTNPIFINGVEIKERAPLSDGDTIKFGNVGNTVGIFRRLS